MPAKPTIAFRFVLLLLVALSASGSTPCGEAVCVEAEEAKDRVTFYATSRSDGASITFSVSVANMKPAFPPILTRSLPRGRTELMTLVAVPNKAWSFEYAYLWRWGIAGAKHDDRVSYRLPFESGKRAYLFQGPNGSHSHAGMAAYDFPMTVGTPVCAARGGVVVDVIDRFDEGGNDRKFLEMSNSILIVHDDGTLGAYLHLLRGGMRVRQGDRVEAGAVIGMCGNSGWSSGPHLHFEVQQALDGTEHETVPVKFRTADQDGVVLAEGKWYSTP